MAMSRLKLQECWMAKPKTYPRRKITFTFSDRPEDAKYLLDGLRAHYEKMKREREQHTEREREKAASEP